MMNCLLIGFAMLMVAFYFGTRCQNSESIPNDKSTPSTAVIPGSNPNCKGGNENPLENPPGFQPCPQRDFKNNPEIQRQIYLMQDNDFFKALRPSSESSGGCPVVTNSYGLPNIASLYFGGSIASIRNTVPFVPKESKCGSSGCLNLAEVILQPDLLKPGNNWHFKGEEAIVVIELTAPADITGFTVIHPKSTELPRGYFKSAPKQFEVYGLKDLEDKNPHSLGAFEYREDGPSAQTFLAEHIDCDVQFKFVEVRFRKNHGNPAYSAIYKIEVHGDFGVPWFESVTPEKAVTTKENK